MAPMYDWECPHKHHFEAMVPMDQRDEPIQCVGKVARMIPDDELEPIMSKLEGEFEKINKDEAYVIVHDADIQLTPMIQGVPWSKDTVFVTRLVPCALKAKRVEISHSNPTTMLDHGLCANRDAAREGRYDPNSPSTRGVRR